MHFFQEKSTKLSPSSSSSFSDSILSVKGVPLWWVVGGWYKTQQGGAVQGGRLGVWELSDPVMSVPEDSHYCWKSFFLNVIVAGSLKNYRPAKMNQIL